MEPFFVLPLKKKKPQAQIHLLGNVLIWYSATLALAAYSALLVLYLLRRRRQCFDIDDAEWRQFRTTGEVPPLP